MTTTKTQQRAICPACFAQQAIRKGGALVPHGYTRPQHWHSNVGTCTGAGRQHFGTEAGRDYTSELVARLREGARHTDDDAANVIAGTASVMQRERIKGTRVVTMKAMENPTAHDRKFYAQQLTATAAQMRAQADDLDANVRAWQPVAPITVAAETKQTLLHYRGGYYGGKACASSAMGAHKGWMVNDIAKVTCEKCKARHAAAAAKATTK